MKSFFLVLGIFWGMGVSAQSEPRQSQISHENRTALGLASRFTGYEIDHPGIAITSLVQVLEITNLQQLLPEEDSFRAYGTNAGFDNSILEKYVFMPPGVMVGDSIGGEVVLISARPFPNGNGEANRAIVAKLPDRYRGFIMPERRVQRIVAAVGVEIPKPERSEPIPHPPPKKSGLPQTLDETLKMFPGLAAQIGLDTNKPLPENHRSTRLEPLTSSNMESNSVSPLPTNEPKRRNPFWLWLGSILIVALGIYFWRRERSTPKK